MNVNTTCARNSTFVKWQDGVSMFGVRFGKEDQAEQVFITKRLITSLFGTKSIASYMSRSLQAQAFI